ncbi:PepSY-associated TM helix domain-containing protein [Sphingobacterium prati]|uniref:PepSY-associated TM helix domain-containing protein n=1 Tax=Sphingobacterium prati TaxID=2737006 RepID=UPI00155579EA|nr:PepSY domain-containing protein [Sphingobacterium prati]NPE45833.1 PepSY domain-containing protein [Sphingobacterium prati]
MNLRRYNIYFNTHTISGIIICAILYVIFFAGSFSFFKNEINAWQKNESDKGGTYRNLVFDHLLDSINQVKELKGRDIAFYMQHNGHASYVNIGASQDTIVANKAKLIAAQKTKGITKDSEAKGEKKKKRGRGRRGAEDSMYFSYDLATKKPSDYGDGYTMGEFLYRLHFLAPLNQIGINIGRPFGYTLAGLVSFIFLFALISGLMLHWDKIKSNFFVFRPGNKWKTVWTDMHTALGVIGFPYQFMYALTGIVLIVNSVLIIPFSKYLYDGKEDEVYAALGYNDNTKYTYLYEPLTTGFKMGNFLDKLEEKWPNSHMNRIFIKNYGDRSMHVVALYDANIDKNFAGSGRIVYRVADNKILFEKSAADNGTYLDYVKGFIYRLHLADFGGYPIKIIYFVLGIMGCFVIISGILIWLVARGKNNIPKRKRIFNFWAANVFMAACLTMFPVTAAAFIAVKLATKVDQPFVFHVYFYSWLALGIFYVIRRNIGKTNRETLLLGSILALAIPIVNGVKTGNWVWVSYRSGANDILLVDLLWLSIGIIGLLIFRKMLQSAKKENSSAKQVTSTEADSDIKKASPPKRTFALKNNSTTEV